MENTPTTTITHKGAEVRIAAFQSATNGKWGAAASNAATGARIWVGPSSRTMSKTPEAAIERAIKFLNR